MAHVLIYFLILGRLTTSVVWAQESTVAVDSLYQMILEEEGSVYDKKQMKAFQVYFEVYRLERDVFGHTHYDVSYRVGWPQKEEVDASLFLALEKPNAQLLIKESDLAPEGFRDYQVRYVLPEQSHLIQKRDKNETETEVTVNYEGDRENEFIFLNIDLHQVPVGIHQLVVTVHHAGQRISRDVFFRVVELGIKVKSKKEEQETG